MIKTFIAGLILGIAAVAAALYAYPVVSQHRENSIVSVRANGGNVERFHISVPMDRIMIGAAGIASPVPSDLEWPEAPLLEATNAELFKIRNERDAVVGVASRVAANDAQTGALIEWVVHLPARGSAYVTMGQTISEDGRRLGTLRHGTREFADFDGSMSERFVRAAGSTDEDQQGRIELELNFVSLRDFEE